MYRFRDTLPIDISEQTISGDLVTIENPEEMGVVDSLEVSLEPIQDLNGYDAPWVGGAGKNKLPSHAVGTVTSNGLTTTYYADGSLKINGTATASTDVGVWNSGNVAEGIQGSYKLNGCTNGASSRYQLIARVRNTSASTNRYVQAPNGDVAISTSDTEVINSIYINVKPDVPMNNVMFYPMLRLSTVSDATFEPYENICPISGRTSVETTRTGKNLLTYTETHRTISGVTIDISTDGTLHAYGTATAGLWVAVGEFEAKGGKTYFYGNLPMGMSTTTYFVTRYGSTGNTYEDSEYTFANDTNAVPRFYVRQGVTLDVTFKLVVADADTAQTYTTSLGRTVYGGTLDVVSGLLTVDKEIVDLGTLTWSRSATTTADSYRFYSIDLRPVVPAPSTASTVADILCSQYEAGSAIDTYESRTSIAIAPNKNVYVFDENHKTDDATAFKTAMSGVQFVYPLATPQTYQLTPQQVTLLLGENHLWSDGEISVVWHKDLTKGRTLPTEAVSINGQYIENVLDGYRTLYTKGRESLGAELNTYSVGTADGEKFKNKRYPARELTVGFQLIGDNAEDFREKFNNLNNLLSLDEADFIFHDEEDKFFSGYPIMDAEVEAGQNSVKGEWRIYCAYPFKRSVEPITLTMDDATVTNTTATWAIDYKGAQPARPILRAKFAGAKSGGSSGEDGDCGFVAFMDARENIIQLGNPEVLDLDEYTKAGTLVNKEFVNTSGWTVDGGHSYGGAISGSISTSNTVDAYWNGGKGQTQSYAKPTYGDTGGRVTMHGPTLWKNTAGAVNFTLSAVHRLCVEKGNEYGKFELGAYNHDTGTLVAGFTITKTSNGTTGTVRYIANGEVVGTDKIDLSYNNTHFGYCKRSEVYTTQTYKERAWVKVQVPIGRNKYQTKSQLQWVNKTRQVFSGYTYTQSNLNSSIQKAGAYVYFQVGNLPKRTFNVPDIEQMVAHDASCHMCAYKTAMHTNMVHSIVFRRQAVTAFAEQPNVFTAGDIVEADCNEATVNIYHAGSMGGHLEPQYGALGNDWENFILTSGANVIQATWSDWVNPTYKPQIEIEYNEVFI